MRVEGDGDGEGEGEGDGDGEGEGEGEEPGVSVPVLHWVCTNTNPGRHVCMYTSNQ